MPMPTHSMRNAVLCLLLSVIFLLPDLSIAQDTATAMNEAPLPDPLYPHYPEKTKKACNGLLAVPATFVVYGAVSLKWNKLKEVNHHFKKEMHEDGKREINEMDNYLQYAPAFMVYALNTAGVKGKNNFIDRTIIYGMANAMMGAVVMTTKKSTHELRPDGSNYMSFPSGHTATAFAAAEFMRREYQDVSIWYGVAGYAMAATTGYMRMSNNRHWFSDVVAGAGVGILSTDLAYWVYPSIKKLFKNKKSDGENIIVPTYQQGAIGLSMIRTFR
ncbi:phosphatase PAP2 family protein [Chitinophaga sp. S165]|uniref:phosphatase PAP2 family protein n=1 Tax=Chitinophaga sp. S165 TaxID=2135462 RepID=UPI001E369614|nr:phosphatase PAP2 family protein [Chitinophaga sp. S165]